MIWFPEIELSNNFLEGKQVSSLALTEIRKPKIIGDRKYSEELTGGITRKWLLKTRECIECNSATRCTWLKTNEELDQDRQAFNNHQFRVGLIPDNKSAVVVWNETSSKVTNYLIYVYKKADKNLDVNRNQQTPLMIRTINKEYTSTGNNSHRITGLTNGVTYSISVNKVSSINDESGQKLIKASNTIDIVPSFVNLINFSALDRDNTLKQERLKSLGTMDSLRGKHLNFNIS